MAFIIGASCWGFRRSLAIGSEGALAWGISPTALWQKAHLGQTFTAIFSYARSTVFLNLLLFSALHSCSKSQQLFCDTVPFMHTHPLEAV